MKLLLLIIFVFSPVCFQAQTSATDETVKSPVSSDAPKAKGALPDEKIRPVNLPRFDKPPVIDGKLDDEVWTSAVVLKDFLQTQPGDNIAPSRQTEVLLGYDSANMYIAFRAFDEPGSVRATLAGRDAIFEDDTVRVLLDTFDDRQRAYVLVFNPFGVQADGILTEGRGEDYSFDLLMNSKGVLTETGYTVEVAVPFKSLRYESGKDKSWGIHFFRRIKRFNNELDSWMPISRDVSSVLGQAGRITSPEGIASGRVLEITPSLTLSKNGERVRTISTATIGNPILDLSGRFVNRPFNFDPGLTVKFGITPNVTLDFALNPDFAQVEADETVVTANQRFPIFFEEKRPFFLEGIDIFQTPLGAVHTRAIVDPDYAVKLTGKIGKNTFGVLAASDNARGNFSEEDRNDPDVRPNIERFLDKNSLIGVLRLKRDIGRESNIGFVATSYNFVENHNQLAGFDGRFRLDPKTVFTFQAVGTTSRRFFFNPESGRSEYRTGNGFGYLWDYAHSARRTTYGFFGQGRTKDYRAEVGFTPRRNTNLAGFYAYYNSEPKPDAKLVSWRAFNGGNMSFDWQGRIQNWRDETRLELNFQRQTQLRVAFEGGYERLFEEEFGAKRTPSRPGAFFGNDSERSTYTKTIYTTFRSTPSKKLSAFFYAGYAWGTFDFDFGAGPRFPRVSPPAIADPNAPLDPGAGKSLDIEASFTYQPTAALRASFEYTKSRLTRNDTGRSAFDQNIFELNATYQFTRSTFARARVDYDTLAANVRGQFLVGWTPSPGTSFFVGYNDDLNYNGFNPFTERLEPGFRRNGRTFFIKLSYLFRRRL